MGAHCGKLPGVVKSRETVGCSLTIWRAYAAIESEADTFHGGVLLPGTGGGLERNETWRRVFMNKKQSDFLTQTAQRLHLSVDERSGTFLGNRAG